MERPLHAQRLVHLLDATGPSDSKSAVAQVVTPDGGRVDLSGEVFAAVEQVLACAAQGLSVAITPLGAAIYVADAETLTGIPNHYVRRLVDEGRLAAQADPFGEQVLLRDLLSAVGHDDVDAALAYEEYLRLEDEADG